MNPLYNQAFCSFYLIAFWLMGKETGGKHAHINRFS